MTGCGDLRLAGLRCDLTGFPVCRDHAKPEYSEIARNPGFVGGAGRAPRAVLAVPKTIFF